MSTLAFQVSEVLSAGWNGFKKNALIMIVLVLISFAVNFVSRLLFGWLPIVLLSAITLALSAYIMLSTVKACLKIVKGETPGWDVLKNDWNSFLAFLGLNLIFSLVLFVSAIFLIFPAFLALALIFPAQYIIVDKNTTIVNAYKRAADITTKNFFPCLIYILLAFFIVLAGALLFGIGLLVALPIVYISAAEAYSKLELAENSAAETVPSAGQEQPVKADDIIKR